YGAGDELHLAFNFGFLGTKWSAEAFRDAAATWYAALPEGAWPVFTLSNHDQPRHAWRYRGRDAVETEGRAGLAAALLLSLRGTPFLYYGEEIAMGCHRLPRSRLRDPLGIKTWPLAFLGRDPERRPMQWSADAGAGFSRGGGRREGEAGDAAAGVGPANHDAGLAPAGAPEPWLPLNPDWRERNVEAQLGDPTSVLSRYRELLALRRSHPALREGSLRFFEAGKDVLAYEREGGGERLLVFLNFASSPRRFVLSETAEIVFGEGRRGAGIGDEGGHRFGPGGKELEPLGCLILRMA
ncbi:MAG TPA: DUF3459 domain-containing protein, partial [Rectinemataceae bacterium]|nr:DUF3459 domain-containing protein [Rectinemataceae bacterium]